MSQGRSLIKQIFLNFIDSFKARDYWGELKGTDHFGTEYYEASTTRKRPSRWFSPKTGDFEQEIPVEWQSWLNHKRKLPPTNEEIQRNLLKMKMTLENAKQLEKPKAKQDIKVNIEKPTFPIYEDYEIVPQLKKRDEK